MKHFILFGLFVASPSLVLADFSYQQTTRITGGAMAGMMKFAGAFSKKATQPMTSTVIVKGNRMVNLSPEHASIVDLDKETVTTVNFERKTYTVMTFEQMRQMMQQMSERMKGGSHNQGTDVKFKVSSKETGRTDTIAGVKAKEVVITIVADAANQQQGSQGTMNISSSVWIAPDVDGYGEVRQFHKKMGEKLGMLPDEQMAQMRQNMAGMMEISKTMAKMDGVPVRTVMTMGGTATQTGGSAQQQPPPPADDSSQGGLGGLARGLGGFGHKKKSDDSSNPDSVSGTLMETTTESSGFSSAPVDASKFEVPAGFKQVENEMGRHQR
jgi:hypothetical protein